jgi:hypothetical protein
MGRRGTWACSQTVRLPPRTRMFRIRCKPISVELRGPLMVGQRGNIGIRRPRTPQAAHPVRGRSTQWGLAG